MITKRDRKSLSAKRHYRIRRKIYGTADRPRLAVHKSNKHIYAQLIDDDAKITLVSASTLEKSMRDEIANGGNVDAAKQVGKLLAERAREKGIEVVVFDRGGFLYHGRIAALADAAREGGLLF
jgi:large subunit ribosomal protein L18